MNRSYRSSGHNFDVHVENYLKALWNLTASQNSFHVGVRSVDLARHLEVTRPSVSSMLEKLLKLKLVERLPDSKKVALTEKGKKEAILLVRKHRLIEHFLHVTLKLDTASLHNEAELLEHAVSPNLLRAIDNYLGEPHTDSHGMPIPQLGETDYFKRMPDNVLIGKAPEGSKLEISSIADYDPSDYLNLSSKGLKAGMALELVEKNSEGLKLLEIKQPQRRLSVSHKEAMLLKVKIIE